MKHLLKDILEMRQVDVFNENSSALEWLAHYYATSITDVIRSILPVGARSGKKWHDQYALPFVQNALTALVETRQVELTKDQNETVSRILRARDKPHLVHGVTSSGKTEVYLAIMRQMLIEGKSTLILVPEIPLTYVLSERLRQEYGDRVFVVHSGLTDKERRLAWLGIHHATASIVVRTNRLCSLYSKFRVNHHGRGDSAYKQEQTLIQCQSGCL